MRLVVLFLIALAAHLARVHLWTPYPDELQYGLAARSLGEPIHLSYAVITPSYLEAFRFPPLFTYLGFLAQGLGADFLSSVRIAAAVLGAGIIPAVYTLLSEVSDRRAATLGALLLLVLYPLNIFSVLGRPETGHLLCFLVSAIFLLRWARDGRRRQVAGAGIAIGAGVWFHEVSLSYALAAVVYLCLMGLLRQRRIPYREIFWLCVTLGLSMAPLLFLGHREGGDLLLEVSTDKSWRVTVDPLSFPAAVRSMLTSLTTMLGVPAFGRIVLGPACLVSCAYLLLRSVAAGSPIGVLVFSYLSVALPFFTWYPERFDYHLLPGAVLLLVLCVRELLAFLPGSTRSPSESSRPRLLGGFQPYLTAAAACVLGVLAIANVLQDRALFAGRGEYDYLRQFIAASPARERVVAFPNLYLGWLSERDGRGVTVLPLFSDLRYSINWPAVEDTGTDAIVLPDFYFERLSQKFPSDWAAVARLFPRRENFAKLVVLRR